MRVDMQADPLKLRDAINGVIRQIPGVATMIGYPIAHRIRFGTLRHRAERRSTSSAMIWLRCAPPPPQLKQVLDAYLGGRRARTARSWWTPCASVAAWMRWRVPG